MISHARTRARNAGVPFSLSENDFEIPDVCPIFGFALQVASGSKGPRAESPTLDRKVPELGYVTGNVWVISMLANRLKGTGSVASVFQLTSDFKEP